MKLREHVGKWDRETERGGGPGRASGGKRALLGTTTSKQTNRRWGHGRQIRSRYLVLNSPRINNDVTFFKDEITLSPQIGRDSNKYFFKNYIQMVNRHMKRIIMSLIDSTHTKDWKDIKLLREVIAGRIKEKGLSSILSEFHFNCITLIILLI